MAKPSGDHIPLGGFVYSKQSAVDEGSRVNGKSESKSQIDLLEIRSQFIELRSLHSNNRRVAIEINKLISKIAHLHEPDNRAHEERLVKMIAKTRQAIEHILCSSTPQALLLPKSIRNLSRKSD